MNGARVTDRLADSEGEASNPGGRQRRAEERHVPAPERCVRRVGGRGPAREGSGRAAALDRPAAGDYLAQGSRIDQSVVESRGTPNNQYATSIHVPGEPEPRRDLGQRSRKL